MARSKTAARQAKTYEHKEADSPMRPEIGTQAQFRKQKSPAKYRYDDSLAPALEWDGQNPARERGEAHIAKVEEALASALKKCHPLGKLGAGSEPTPTVVRFE